MNEQTQVLKTIEGCEISVLAQKIIPNYTPVLTITEEMVFPVKISRRGSGTIIAEFNPKAPRFCRSSLLNEGDRIDGKNLWGFSASPITKIGVGKGGRTGKHSGQDVHLDGQFSFLSVVTTWEGKSALTHPKDLYLAAGPDSTDSQE